MVLLKIVCLFGVTWNGLLNIVVGEALKSFLGVCTGGKVLRKNENILL